MSDENITDMYIELMEDEGHDVVKAIIDFKTTHGLFSGIRKTKKLYREVIQFTEVLGKVTGLDGEAKRDIAIDFVHKYLNRRWLPDRFEKWIIGRGIDNAVKFFNKKGGKKWIDDAIKTVENVKDFYEKIKEAVDS